MIFNYLVDQKSFIILFYDLPSPPFLFRSKYSLLVKHSGLALGLGLGETPSVLYIMKIVTPVGKTKFYWFQFTLTLSIASGHLYFYVTILFLYLHLPHHSISFALYPIFFALLSTFHLCVTGNTVYIFDIG